MNEALIEKLRNGCVCHERRWSGDTHSDLGGSVNEVETDKIMHEAADLLESFNSISGDKKEESLDINNSVDGRKNVGVLIYHDDYDDTTRFKFYWGGDGYHDNRILDHYYDAEKVIEKYFNNNDATYEEAVEKIFNFNWAEYMENYYSINKGFEETIHFFENEEVGWRWVYADRDLFAD